MVTSPTSHQMAEMQLLVVNRIGKRGDTGRLLHLLAMTTWKHPIHSTEELLELQPGPFPCGLKPRIKIGEHLPIGDTK